MSRRQPILQDDNFSLSLLNELSVKYGIQTHLSHSPLPQKLEELRDYLRQEIKKELKIMEGAENLRRVATDKKSVSNVNVIVKKSNSKLTELQQELQELESQILVSQGHALNSSGRIHFSDHSHSSKFNVGTCKLYQVRSRGRDLARDSTGEKVTYCQYIL